VAIGLTHNPCRCRLLLPAYQVRIFSRNCEEHTAAFPDVIAAVLAAADPSSLPLVLDAELAAVDRVHGNRLLAFQELATRRRGSAAGGAAAAAASAAAVAAAAAAAAAGDGGGKAKPPHPQRAASSKKEGVQQRLAFEQQRPAGTMSATSSAATDAASDAASDVLQARPSQQQQQQSMGVDVCVFVFDALCVAGRDLMGCSLRERRAAAAAALPHLTPGVVQLVEGIEVAVQGDGPGAAAGGGGGGGGGDGSSSWQAACAQLTDFCFTAFDAGSEGLMLKLLDGPGACNTGRAGGGSTNSSSRGLQQAH
jgi:hypothetical protein